MEIPGQGGVLVSGAVDCKVAACPQAEVLSIWSSLHQKREKRDLVVQHLETRETDSNL